MADVAEFQMMKVSTFSDGTDTYKGIKSIGHKINPLPTVGILLEGDLRPDRHEQIESDTPKVTGRVEMSGPNVDALLDTTIASATALARDVTQASGTKTITYTNMTIKSSDTGVQNRSVQGATYEFEADDVAITTTA